MNTELAPTLIYGVEDEEIVQEYERKFDCEKYGDCLTKAAIDNEAKSFTCEGCPGVDGSKNEPAPEAVPEEETIREEEQERLFPEPPPFLLKTVPLQDVTVDYEMEEASFRSLARSVEALGVVLQPVILVETAGEKYRVYAGKRRVLSAKSKKLTSISAMVFPAGTPESLLNVYAVAENMNRSFNPADEADKIRKIMTHYGWTAEETAKRLSVPVAHVRQRLRLTMLIPEFFDMLRKGTLKVSVALKIARLPVREQKALLKKEKLTMDTVEKASKSFRLDTLIGDDSLFETPPVTRSPLEEAVEKIRAVIDESERDTSLLERAAALIEKYLGGGK